MSAIKDGGPAFPVPPTLHEGNADSYWSQHPASGMSLRDYFAAKAMQSLVDPQFQLGQKEAAAVFAYAIADAMLAARGDA